jgi:hypothetical protein
MPLLEVTQTRHVSTSIRLTDSTATQVDQYAAFIRASADDVVEQALAYIFSKDRDFYDFLKSPEAQRITPTLRVPRVPTNDATEPAARKPIASASLPTQNPQQSRRHRRHDGRATTVLRTGRISTLHPAESRVRGSRDSL